MQWIFRKFFSSDLKSSIVWLFFSLKGRLFHTFITHYFHRLNVQKCWKFYWARKQRKPAAKKRKVTEKKTPLPKGMNIKTKFTKILTCREANDTEQKMKFSIEDFFSKCEHETADLVTFTEEILHGKLHFLCSMTRFRLT